MHNKTKKILKTLLTVAMLVVCFTSCVYATGTTSGGGIISEVTKGEVTPDDGGFADILNAILGYVVWFGWFIAIAMIITVGIRYTMAPANERADLKNGSIRYIIGVLLLASLTTVFGAIMGIFSEAAGGGTGTGGGTGAGGSATTTTNKGNGSGAGGGSSSDGQNNVNKIIVAMPSLEGEQRYTGSMQTPKLRNLDTSKISIAYYEKDGLTPTTNTLKDVGEKKIIKVSLKDKSKYTWTNGSTDDITINWEIKPMILKVDWLSEDTFTYDGNEHLPRARQAILNGVNGETIEIIISGASSTAGKHTAKAEMSAETLAKGYAKNYVLENAQKEYTIVEANG